MAKILAEEKHLRQCTNIPDKDQNQSTLQNPSFYTNKLDCAIVTAASKAPRDSQAGPTWFRRGVSGLQRWLKQLWKSRTFYIGEWHYHPFAPPDPSGTDVSEMKDVSNDAGYQCPEPVLVILGGDPAGAITIRAFVFPCGQVHVELLPVAEVGTA